MAVLEITVLGIVTHDRVTSLAACLESYRANCRRHARLPEFVVMDDVADDDAGGRESSARVRAALQAFQRTGDETVRYAGPSEKRRFAEALARESSISRDVVDFALFGDRRCGLLTGANRNGLLLDTVGTAVFGADDDTRARTAAAPEGENPVSFSSEYEPREFWFFPDPGAAGDRPFGKANSVHVYARHDHTKLLAHTNARGPSSLRHDDL